MVDGKTLTVESKSRFGYGKILADSGPKNLEKAARDWLGEGATVTVVEPTEAEPAPAAETGGNGQAAIAEARREMRDHPIVQEILEIFDGRIVDLKLSGKKT